MPKTEETWMDGITTEMMEHICDNLCRYPDQLSEMELEDKCAECKMGRFVCDILNQYNKVNDFANSQCAKLMSQIHELKERDTAKKTHIKTQKYSQAHKCPNCKKTMIFKDETGYFCGMRHKFCQSCGQRLDWNE